MTRTYHLKVLYYTSDSNSVFNSDQYFEAKVENVLRFINSDNHLGFYDSTGSLIASYPVNNTIITKVT